MAWYLWIFFLEGYWRVHEACPGLDVLCDVQRLVHVLGEHAGRKAVLGVVSPVNYIFTLRLSSEILKKTFLFYCRSIKAGGGKGPASISLEGGG